MGTNFEQLQGELLQRGAVTRRISQSSDPAQTLEEWELALGQESVLETLNDDEADEDNKRAVIEEEAQLRERLMQLEQEIAHARRLRALGITKPGEETGHVNAQSREGVVRGRLVGDSASAAASLPLQYEIMPASDGDNRR